MVQKPGDRRDWVCMRAGGDRRTVPIQRLVLMIRLHMV